MSGVIEELRFKIDRVDDALLELLKCRLILASQIGKIKNQSQQEVLDIQREEEILERLSRKEILTREQIEPIYQAIFALTKQIQEEQSCNFNPFL